MREKIDFTANYGEKADTSIIKVIGVGGGGGNAVQHMYEEGIEGVNFLICNTDRGALENNLVPSQLVLGDSGLGAGADPDKARELALATKEKLIDFIGKETKMLFITAGMGKGTGTGAAPVVAEIAREMGILTIAVVTYPFKFEGKLRSKYADNGIEELRKHVDSLIVVKNQNIIKYYKDDDLSAAFGYADDVLKNAVKCIAELITKNAEQNVDFNDVRTIMQNSGEAMLGLAQASGENRINDVVKNALSCPLLQEEHITNAKSMLFFVSYSKIGVSEFEQLTDQMEALQNEDSTVIWGRSIDDSLGDSIKLSVIVTRYNGQDNEPVQERENGSNINWDDILTKQNGTQGKTFDITEINKTPNSDFDAPKTEPNSPFNWVHSQQTDTPQNSVNREPQAVLSNPPMTATIPVAAPGKPQMIRNNNDPRYENNSMFNTLVNEPAIRRCQSGELPFANTSTMVSQRRINELDVEDDLHDFFKNIPD